MNIKKCFQNKIFLNVAGYTLAFTLGLFLAFYVSEREKTTIQSEQRQAKKSQEKKATRAKDEAVQIEKLEDKIYMVKNPNSAILSDKYILQQEMNYTDRSFHFDSYQAFSKDNKHSNHVKIKLFNQFEELYKDYDLVQLAQSLHSQAIPGKVSHQLYQDPQDGQYYFAFEVYLPGGKQEKDYSNADQENPIYTLYTNIENGQTFYLEDYFKPLSIRDKYPVYGASNLDDKLEKYGLLLVNSPHNFTLIQGEENLQIKKLKLSQQFPNIEEKLAKDWSLMVIGEDSYETSIKLLASEGETDLYTNVKLESFYSSDDQEHLLKDYQDFLRLYQAKMNKETIPIK
ncbi:hypothetical protein [Streptococcus sp. DD04]|uniref:hypothetical protein n=1 Tax=Streptococcus sp. DD04 TaxID=1776578 RepID=UPI000795D153|nr:hypothetical protein [Streptococcus sp. DD04]KXT64490.1 hypothetical protein STRDD04_01214 [Streptococcus sp. DD04]